MLFFFFFNDTATTEIYTLSLHDALPISRTFGPERRSWRGTTTRSKFFGSMPGFWICTRKHLPWVRSRIASERSEEHTSELQSPCNLVCRLLLEKKKDLFLHKATVKLFHY